MICERCKKPIEGESCKLTLENFLLVPGVPTVTTFHYHQGACMADLLPILRVYNGMGADI